MILKKFRFFDKLSLNEDYKQLKDRNAANNIYRVGTSTLAGNYVRPSFNEKALVVDSRTPRL